jgi:hypothetical protein
MKIGYLEQIRQKIITVQFEKPAELYIPGAYNRLNRLLQYSAFAFILLGIKLWLISNYANATPYWDQWDAEAANLYKPYIDGSLGWDNLFAPHNEHRIFTTRLLALVLFNINKIWNPLLQMEVNAVLFIIMLVTLISLLTKVIEAKFLAALLFFSLFLFGIPYAWENTLAGFQSQFFFVILFSVVSLWCVVTQIPFSLKWWAGVGCSILAFLSMASGILALATAAFISLIFYLTGLRKNIKQLMAFIFLAALFVIGAKLTPSLDHHKALAAGSVGQFIAALGITLGWPVSENIIAAFICYSPAGIFLVHMIRKRPPATAPEWFLAAMVVWSFAQCLLIAYGRAGAALASRYLDTFAIGLLVNFACLLIVAKNYIHKMRRLTLAGVFCWTTMILVSLGIHCGTDLPRWLTNKKNDNLAEQLNTRHYLASGNIQDLTDKGPMGIPYPDPNRLAMILSWPEIRKILPGNLMPLKPITIQNKPEGTFITNGYFPTTGNATDSTLGSYHSEGPGDGAIGEAIIQFSSNQNEVKFDVAGFPLNEGMKLEIEQNGHRKPVSIKDNPKESWKTVYAKVDKGPFSIRITDSSTTTWMAITMPLPLGRIDRLVEKTYYKYYLFLFLGVAMVLFLIMKHILTDKGTAQEA